MRAGLYARVSTNDQKSEMQLRELREYCKHHAKPPRPK
jgi:DNA invertase Pin-like site-specific DNA recombinase